jgi:hypothetical protein
MAKNTINVTMDSGLRNHLETMATIQSSIENRKVSMAEICRKMLVAQSGYGIKRFCMETLTPIESGCIAELERLNSQPHYKPKEQAAVIYSNLD